MQVGGKITWQKEACITGVFDKVSLVPKELVRNVDWPYGTFMTCSANFVLDSVGIGIATQISIIVNTFLIMN